MTIESVFGAEGLLAAKFKGYAPRKGQVDMAIAVEKAIAEKGHLIAEGPTGTGKSLAYLVPAIEWATKKEAIRSAVPKKVIVVTGNIALQEQLVGKDLPLLQAIMPEPFDFCLSKGKNNYLCVDALGKALANNALAGKDGQIARLLAWAQSTVTGDVSEFPETPEPALWRQMSVGSDECKGNSCKWFAKCFAEKAKRAQVVAQVVVTNYHMFFAHLVVRAKMKELQARGAPVELDIVLPPADVIVFDEAHKAADIARDFLGFQITKGSIDWLVRGFQHELAGQTKAAAERFFRAMAEHRRTKQYKSRLKKGHPLAPVALTLADLLTKVAQFYKVNAASSAWAPDEKAELDMRAKRGFTLATQLQEAMEPEKHPDVVYFIEETQNGNAILKSKPIQVGAWLENELFGSFPTVVVTSATLATGSSGGFEFVKKELGLKQTAEMVAESPFSWKNQVLFVVPKTMTDPKDYGTFAGSVADHVAKIARASRGRLLGLFTSFKVLDAAHRACSDLPYRVFKQGEAPRTMLVNKFKEDVESCLLGCESFWAGVDVPGESLSCVVIDRLPFPTPEDPIVDAIAEKDDRWFFNYAVPRAIIQFKQGFGRLIRTTSDRGVVVCLDRRVTDMSYGRSFVAALPRGIGFSRDVSDVEEFFAAYGT